MAEPSRTERVLGPIKVGLRNDLQVRRISTSGGPRYVVHDPITFQNHAFTVADYRLLTAIVRHRSLAETHEHLVHRGSLSDSDQDRSDFYKFVLWLHNTGLLHLPITGGDGHYERHKKKQLLRGPWYKALMSHRVPLWNPDNFLQRTHHLVGWLFRTPGLLLWLTLLAAVGWRCIGRVDQMIAESKDLLALANLPVLWAALIGLKVLHEFGHAYACRSFGGVVPEMGVQMIMMTPCAYVDANASWQLRGARQRIVVGLGGMYVESFVAAIAGLLWAGTQPGFAHALALNVVVLASVVTLLFNANPLMRYDGYFVFSDLVGVFNLQSRAAAFLRGWAGYLLLGLPRPHTWHSASERLLYSLYGPAAFAYRVTLALTLTRVMTLRWPGAGLFLGAVFGFALIVNPLLRLLDYLWHAPATAAVRTRSRTVAVLAFVAAPLLLGFVPISASVVAPGILDPRLHESVRAPASGFVTELETGNGREVEAGSHLCTLRNPELEMRRTRLLGELDAEAVSLDASELSDPTQASIHKARLGYLRSSVQEIDHRLAVMRITADVKGTVTKSGDLQLDGRFLQQGEELFQIQADHHYLRVLLTDEDVTRARLELGSTAEVRWNCAPDQPTKAYVREIRETASRYTVPAALTILGGGSLYARPSSNGPETDEPYLHVLFEVESVPLNGNRAGLTAQVRLPGRVELLGSWVQNRLIAFVNSWRMS